MATRFREPSRFRDSPGVIRVGGAGVLNVVRASPKALGVPSPLARIVLGVGGHRAGSWLLAKCTGVYGGAVGCTFSGALALAWVSASQCLGPLGLLVVVDVACLLLALQSH